MKRLYTLLFIALLSMSVSSQDRDSVSYLTGGGTLPILSQDGLKHDSLIQFRWQRKLPATFQAAPVTKYGRMYVGDDSTAFYAFDNDNGRILWRYKTGYPIHSTAAVADGHVVFGCTNGTVYCLSVETGKRQWAYKTGRTIEDAVQIRRGKVYFKDDSTHYVLGLLTGKPIKKVAAGDTLLPHPVDSLYWTSDGVITAQDTVADSIRWQVRVSGQSVLRPAILKEDEVLFVTEDGIAGMLHRVEPILPPDSIPTDSLLLRLDTVTPVAAKDTIIPTPTIMLK